jgi:hypothetical protein
MAQVSSKAIPPAIVGLTIQSAGVIGLDPWLEPFREPLKHRYAKAENWIKTINESEGGLEKFSRVRAFFADVRNDMLMGVGI